ncbi:MAG: histidine triad nucleotide-binding protein [bacterium]
MNECLFCKIISGEVSSQKVYETKDIYAFEDVNPVAPTHILIVPKRHLETMLELSDDHCQLIGSIHLAANHIARIRGIAETGFRVVTNCGRDANQTVFHIHFHLIGGRPMEWPPG